jgi:hypothetical protein
MLKRSLSQKLALPCDIPVTLTSLVTIKLLDVDRLRVLQYVLIISMVFSMVTNGREIVSANLSLAAFQALPA